MARRKIVDQQMVESIAKLGFDVVPVINKRLLCIDSVQSEHDMPFSHIQAMMVLGEKGTLSVSDLSRRLDIAKSNITPLIDRLIEQGYVERVRSTQDKRIINIVLLPAGVEKLNSIMSTIVHRIMGWGPKVQEGDFADLLKALNTIHTILENIAP